MPTRALPVLVLLAVAFLLLVSSLFTVAQTELAIRSRFGEILQAEYKPGLHLRVPFVDTVRKFERRIITRELPVGELPDQRGQDSQRRLLREVAHH